MGDEPWDYMLLFLDSTIRVTVSLSDLHFSIKYGNKLFFSGYK